jgi:hypothetical protein
MALEKGRRSSSVKNEVLLVHVIFVHQTHVYNVLSFLPTSQNLHRVAVARCRFVSCHAGRSEYFAMGWAGLPGSPARSGLLRGGGSHLGPEF